MRSHHATSSASSSREKCTRPRVVGPSPAMTPSRTIVSARAAVSRQEISEGSKAEIDSAEAAKGADIGICSSQFLALVSPADVNDWLTIRNPIGEIFTRLAFCRGSGDDGSRWRPAGCGSHKRRYQGNGGRPIPVLFRCFTCTSRKKVLGVFQKGGETAFFRSGRSPGAGRFLC